MRALDHKIFYYSISTRYNAFLGILEGLHALLKCLSSAFACTSAVFVCKLSLSVSSFVLLILRMLVPCVRCLVQVNLLMPLLNGHCS